MTTAHDDQQVQLFMRDMMALSAPNPFESGDGRMFNGVVAEIADASGVAMISIRQVIGSRRQLDRWVFEMASVADKYGVSLELVGAPEEGADMLQQAGFSVVGGKWERRARPSSPREEPKVPQEDGVDVDDDVYISLSHFTVEQRVALENYALSVKRVGESFAAAKVLHGLFRDDAALKRAEAAASTGYAKLIEQGATLCAGLNWSADDLLRYLHERGWMGDPKILGLERKQVLQASSMEHRLSLDEVLALAGVVPEMKGTGPQLGEHIEFTANDAGDPLSVGVVRGVIVDIASTSAGNLRYRIMTDRKSLSGEGVEILVYSHQGRIVILPPSLESAVFDVRVGIFENDPMQVPDGWVVMNASRPLLGSRTEENTEAWPGRMFYAAIDPADPMASRYIEENKRLDARVVFVASREEQVGMAVARSEYRERYYEMEAEERARSAAGLMRSLNEKTFGEAKALLEEVRAYLATLQAPEVQRASLTADGTVAETGEVKAPGSLPDMAVVRDMDGKLFIVTYGRFDRVGGQPFTPGERPEMSHEVQVSFDLSEARRNPDMRAGPLFYTGLRYDGDWENVAKYQPAQVQEAAAVPEPDFPGFTRLPNGNWVGNRSVYYGDLSVDRLDAMLRRVEPRPDDIEPLKDYKWMLLFDQQTADEKGFMHRYNADGGPVMVPVNKFWLVNIDERIRALGGDPQDLTNNPLVLNLQARTEAAAQPEEREFTIDLSKFQREQPPVFPERETQNLGAQVGDGPDHYFEGEPLDELESKLQQGQVLQLPVRVYKELQQLSHGYCAIDLKEGADPDEMVSVAWESNLMVLRDKVTRGVVPRDVADLMVRLSAQVTGTEPLRLYVLEKMHTSLIRSEKSGKGAELTERWRALSEEIDRNGALLSMGTDVRALDLNVEEGLLRAFQVALAKKGHETSLGSAKQRSGMDERELARLTMAADAEYERAIRTPPPDILRKIARAVVERDAETLSDYFVYGLFEDCQKVFSAATGVKMSSGCSKNDKLSRLFEWAGDKSKMEHYLNKRESRLSEESAAKEMRNRESAARDAWQRLSAVTVGIGDQGEEAITGQEWVTRQISDGYDVICARKDARNRMSFVMKNESTNSVVWLKDEAFKHLLLHSLGDRERMTSADMLHFCESGALLDLRNKEAGVVCKDFAPK